jgi:tyrosyl-tRNA synthetase
VDPQTFWNDLERRGIVQQSTSPEMPAWIAKQLAGGKPVRVYAGFDPTADSLHLGSLMPVLGLRRFMQSGLVPIALVGGATGMIGDPSGKSAERSLLDSETLEANVAGLSAQLEKLFQGTVGRDFLLLNNADWFRPITYIDFLRDVGKHFSVNMMMAKESVRARLEDRDQGISYTEFSYMLLQAYDFWHLYRHNDCKMQIGGSDQWGNITAGIDLIKRKHADGDAHGCTFPLLTTAGGKKFGKSETGNVWLDARRTHPYFLYKYLFDTDDADVVRLLKYLTFLPMGAIEDLERLTNAQPERRAAQQALGKETTALVHGETIAAACEGLEKAMHADDADAFAVHAGALDLLKPSAAASDEDASRHPVLHRPLSMLAGPGLAAADLAVDAGLFKSKGEVKREIQSGSGGFRVAGQPVTDVEFRITLELLGGRRVIQIRKGKKNKRMVCFYE